MGHWDPPRTHLCTYWGLRGRDYARTPRLSTGDDQILGASRLIYQKLSAEGLLSGGAGTVLAHNAEPFNLPLRVINIEIYPSVVINGHVVPRFDAAGFA